MVALIATALEAAEVNAATAPALLNFQPHEEPHRSRDLVSYHISEQNMGLDPVHFGLTLTYVGLLCNQIQLTHDRIQCAQGKI